MAAAAVAVVTVATLAGTIPATLDTAAPPTTITTTHPANMHRCGRTIHPQPGGHQCGGFWAALYPFAISFSQGSTRRSGSTAALVSLASAGRASSGHVLAATA